MSIRIDRTRCARCGSCAEACPGNLIQRDADGAAASGGAKAAAGYEIAKLTIKLHFRNGFFLKLIRENPKTSIL